MAGPLDDPNNKKKLEHFLIEHAPLINLHANKLKNAGYLPPDTDMGDVHMAGVHGLMDALEKYHPDTAGGKKFTDYAHSRIRGKMLDS
jgi:DNA-directed RNA polymerase specialized sigma subunit